MADNNDFGTAMETAFEEWIIEVINEHTGEVPSNGMTEQEVIALIDQHAPAGEGGLSEDDVLDLINEHSDSSGDGLSEQDVITLISEHTPDTGSGLTEGQVLALIEENETGLNHSEVMDLIEENTSDGGLSEAAVIALIDEHGGLDDETRARLDAVLERTEGALDDLESRLARVVGPEEPTGDYHTHPGWGTHFETNEPIHFGKATIDGLTSGTVNVELHGYEAGDTTGLVDSTEVTLAQEGEQEVELDIDVEEPGQYLLTRDWDEEPDNVVSMRRQLDYTGWDDDSGEDLTFYGGAHHEFSDNPHWYYFFNLHVTPLGSSDDE